MDTKAPYLRVYKPGDIVLTRGSHWLSRAIRKLTREKGETATQVNHVGMLVTPSVFLGACHIVEAAGNGVVRRRVREPYGPGKGNAIAIYRPITMPPADLEKIVANIEKRVGQKYGYLKLLFHLGDWALGGRYFFRRWGAVDRWPICSYLVASEFGKLGYDFGVPAKAASPDDIWDFCRTTIHYELIRWLEPLHEEEMGGKTWRRPSR